MSKFDKLRVVYRIIKDTPANLVRLDCIRYKDPDGVISGCGVGLCLDHPEFAGSDVTYCRRPDPGSVAEFHYPMANDGMHLGYSLAAVRMFGVTVEESRDLFSSLVTDEEHEMPSAKEVLLLRLEEFFSRRGEEL